MLKYILAILSLSIFALAMDKHNPKVHEDIEETLPEVSRKVRHYGETYKPPVFIYDRTAQPDLRKWRYFQQQRVDSINTKKIRELLESINIFRNDLYSSQDQSSSQSQESSVRLALEPRWKIIHPKFVTERQNDFSPSELVKMQGQYGLRKFPQSENERFNYKNTDLNLNNEDDNKSHYMVEESDLDVDASEVTESQTPLDRQDQISVVLPHTLPSNAQMIYINPVSMGETLAKTFYPGSLEGLSYSQANQKDIDALNSLLGKTPVAQINGLKQLLHSQSVQVAPFANSGSETTHISNDGTQLTSQSAALYSDASNNQNPSQPIQNNIVQVNGQTLEQLQVQLDNLSQQEGERAIAEAHQKAIEYVKSQQRAIELAQVEQQNIALATIKAHNLRLGEPLPQSLPLVQAEEPTQPQQNTQIGAIPQHYEASFGMPTMLNLEQNIHQRLLTDNNGAGATEEQDNSLPTQETHFSTPTKNKYGFIQPEVNHSGSNGVNQPLPTHNVAHTQLQAEAYEKLASNAYSQHTEDLQNANSEKAASHQQSVYQNGHNNEYAPKYAFGYRVMDYHSGVDYGHEESRDSKVTKGRYHVLLPDGRMQNVNYWADATGYHAKVTYSDVSHH